MPKRGLRSQTAKSVRFLRGQLARDPNNQKLKDIIDLAVRKLEEKKAEATRKAKLVIKKDSEIIKSVVVIDDSDF